ncbi:Gfo/Idh/MocA family protein [Paenibacillus contaminans]|uniref:Gfo/Idh/MocA family oxidoreductase n=1 Tax=Paenibacillus contaminans TaxID=450362 RepID=A0A329MQT7_9BACL|nr:Gfo/Idh/MocA family oxidoreductase [Paenibacillus contaminans]RAV21646.1 gfo/Idh/MocA family oxidoreductase [Paenibacillus contaminans]
MIHFAIIGCGHIAKKHVEAIRNTPGAALIAVCDTNPQRVEEYVREYGVQGYTDLSDMLKNPDIHVVNVCTPSGLHAPLAVAGADAGKHVVVEKPIALTLEDADRIIAACKRNKVKLAVVHPNRFRPAIVELKKALDEQQFGKLSHANATVRWNRNQEYYDQAAWRGTKALDGGVLLNQAIHNLDLLTWLMGEAAELSAFNETRLRNIESEDVSAGIVRFANGALGIIEAAVTVYPSNIEESIAIFGEKASVKISGTSANRIEYWRMAGVSEEETNELIEKVNADPLGKPGHQCLIEDMVQAILDDRTPVVSGEDGRAALKLILDMCEASDCKQVTTLRG